MPNKIKDITGNVYGDLRVMRNLGTRKLNCGWVAYWQVECIHCGKQDERNGKNLRTRKDKNSCKDCHSKTIGKRLCKANWKGTKDIPLSYFTALKSAAAKRGYEFTISIQDLQKLLENQGGRCALTGQRLAIGKGIRPSNQTASVDRIDSNKGYTLGNVQWVLKEINFMKQTLSQDRFLELAKLITEHNG